ncbi:hypothetical protein AMELA_G00056910 [Ameiurus melas]|uniref:Uncharacterized protein n=1 Tax=Ameiurus melas TaxID=219545 RepID=A0A7J6B160_AMEME|nr:hypothetical protein AMELA_G00056910 [Ameiurus melas]
MSFVLQILFALFISLLGGLYLLGAFRRRRSGEPPLDKGPLPWLGHVLEFRRDTAKFLERMRKKHGDIFTVQLGGFYFTFLTDPLSFGSVVKEARAKLDFSEFAKHLVKRVFGYSHLEDDHKLIRASSNKHLMGDGLEDGLFAYCYNIVFRAGYLALFGNEVAKTSESVDKAKEVDRKESNELYYEFRKYDQLFPKLAYGVLGPSEKMEAERLKKLFWKVLAVEKVNTKENISSWIFESQQSRAERGMHEYMLDRHMFILMWASQGNTGPASFWLLLFLMKHPEAMKAVKSEVDEVLHETGQKVKRGGPLINLTRDMLLKTPVLDSAVDESLRMTAAPVLTAALMEDMSLKMDNATTRSAR